ncbi:MAG: hypothetical protein N2645_11205 [Clostridia bacterium]|nr:hypothetical protein [Clostridia bacterium]
MKKSTLIFFITFLLIFSLIHSGCSTSGKINKTNDSAKDKNVKVVLGKMTVELAKTKLSDFKKAGYTFDLSNRAGPKQLKVAEYTLENIPIKNGESEVCSVGVANNLSDKGLDFDDCVIWTINITYNEESITDVILPGNIQKGSTLKDVKKVYGKEQYVETADSLIQCLFSKDPYIYIFTFNSKKPNQIYSCSIDINLNKIKNHKKWNLRAY